MDSGVFYIALGSVYLEEARRSALSVKNSNAGVSIAVFTDQSVESDYPFDIVIPSDSTPDPSECGDRYLNLDRAAYYRKIAPLMESPFERTVFLDTDTWVSGPLEPVFDLLERFDLLVTPCFITHDYKFERNEEPFRSIPEAFGYFNSGFFAFRRNEATQSFLTDWQHIYVSEVASRTVNDQPALRLALFRETQATFHVLPTCYNTISWAPFVIPGGGRVVVLHGRNPWLQKWCHHFASGKPAIVGSMIPSLQFRYHLARVFFFFKRMGEKWGFSRNRSD